MNLEQIALRVAKESGGEDDYATPGFVKEFSHRLVAALGAQEPVAWMDKNGRIHKNKLLLTAYGRETAKPLYAAPPICPTCTQMIDEAAREGRIVDDRKPWPDGDHNN